MLKRIAVFAALLIWCAALLTLRIARANALYYVFLIWNLFLAAIPFAASLAIEALDAHRVERRRPAGWPGAVPAPLSGTGGETPPSQPARTPAFLGTWACFATWLLFLPNAPYIMTDFLHLRDRPPIPLWYDVLLLLSCSGAGLLLGYASVMIVQRVITRHYGVMAGWATALSALLLSAFGIYLGRFLRWNSWEALTDPMPLFSDIASHIVNPLHHPKALAVTALFGIALCLGYIALDVVAEGERPST
jgi:uncharacterized membrane protein